LATADLQRIKDSPAQSEFPSGYHPTEGERQTDRYIAKKRLEIKPIKHMQKIPEQETKK